MWEKSRKVNLIGIKYHVGIVPKATERRWRKRAKVSKKNFIEFERETAVQIKQDVDGE